MFTNRDRGGAWRWLVVMVAVGLSAVAGGPAVGADSGPPSPVRGKYFSRDFVVVCAFSHRLADDPIVHPGRPGGAHQHDFWGNSSTDAFSTQDSLLAAPTTCNRPGDTAAYWMPSLLEDGRPVDPGDATFYYRGVGSDPTNVFPFPPNFRMVAGDQSATTAQPLNAVEWACRDEGAKKPWRAELPACPAGSALAFRVNFADCWNGRDLDSADHRSHVAYSDQSGRCPASHPVAIPEIAMTVTYPRVSGGQLSLSSGSPYSGHADFLNAWRQSDLVDLVGSCLLRSRQCSHFQGPGGAGPIGVGESAVKGPGPATVAALHRVSDGRSGPGHFSQSPAVSADGRRMVFESHVGGRSDLFVHDRATGITSPLTRTTDGGMPDGSSYDPSLSGDGRYVAFRSVATNLVAGDTNQRSDVFVTDTATGAITRESVSTSGTEADHHSFAPAISADGRYLAFESFAGNLVTGDLNRRSDVFRRHRQSGRMERVSVAFQDPEADQSSYSSSISADGRFVAFDSWASNLTGDDRNRWSDVFVRDMVLDVTTLVSVGRDGAKADNSSFNPSLSADGAVVAFESPATNLVRGDKGYRDVFVRDLGRGTTMRVSAGEGRKLDGLSANASISANGRRVAFESANSRLVIGDANGVPDVVVMDLSSGSARRVSNAPDGANANSPSGFPALSGDGSVVAFESTAGNLVAGGSRGGLEVYSVSLP